MKLVDELGNGLQGCYIIIAVDWEGTEDSLILNYAYYMIFNDNKLLFIFDVLSATIITEVPQDIKIDEKHLKLIAYMPFIKEYAGIFIDADFNPNVLLEVTFIDIVIEDNKFTIELEDIGSPYSIDYLNSDLSKIIFCTTNYGYQIIPVPYGNTTIHQTISYSGVIVNSYDEEYVSEPIYIPERNTNDKMFIVIPTIEGNTSKQSYIRVITKEGDTYSSARQFLQEIGYIKIGGQNKKLYVSIFTSNDWNDNWNVDYIQIPLCFNNNNLEILNQSKENYNFEPMVIIPKFETTKWLNKATFISKLRQRNFRNLKGGN